MTRITDFIFSLAQLITEFDQNKLVWLFSVPIHTLWISQKVLSLRLSIATAAASVMKLVHRTSAQSVCVCVLDECHLPIDRVAQRPIVSLVNGALLHSRLGSCSSDDSNSLELTVRLDSTDVCDLRGLRYRQHFVSAVDRRALSSDPMIAVLWVCTIIDLWEFSFSIGLIRLFHPLKFEHNKLSIHMYTNTINRLLKLTWDVLFQSDGTPTFFLFTLFTVEILYDYLTIWVADEAWNPKNPKTLEPVGGRGNLPDAFTSTERKKWREFMLYISHNIGVFSPWW